MRLGCQHSRSMFSLFAKYLPALSGIHYSFFTSLNSIAHLFTSLIIHRKSWSIPFHWDGHYLTSLHFIINIFIYLFIFFYLSAIVMARMVRWSKLRHVYECRAPYGTCLFACRRCVGVRSAQPVDSDGARDDYVALVGVRHLHPQSVRSS